MTDEEGFDGSESRGYDDAAAELATIAVVVAAVVVVAAAVGVPWKLAGPLRRFGCRGRRLPGLRRSRRPLP